MTSHYLNQRWLIYRCIYSSLCLNELKQNKISIKFELWVKTVSKTGPVPQKYNIKWAETLVKSCWTTKTSTHSSFSSQCHWSDDGVPVNATPHHLYLNGNYLKRDDNNLNKSSHKTFLLNNQWQWSFQMKAILPLAKRLFLFHTSKFKEHIH